MPEFSPDALATWTGGSWVGRPSAAISGFAIDSRKATAGDCFIALRAEPRDGHEFVAAAARAGAVAAIVREAVAGAEVPQLVVPEPLLALQACARAHRAAFTGTVVGITGSAGKTSTKELLARMLGPEQTLATTGNLNNFLGVPLTLLRLDSSRHRFAVVEVGINLRGEMADLADLLRPDAAIVTNVGAAHLEGLGSVEGAAAEKVRLLAAVPPAGWRVFPEDCLRHQPFSALRGGRAIVAEAPSDGTANVIFQAKRKPSTEAESEAVFAAETAGRETPGSVLLQVDLPGLPVLLLELPSMSSGMRMNAVLAATLARLLGRSAEAVIDAARGWQPVAWRGESRRWGDQLFYLDCYNANPLSMSDALRYFSERHPVGPRLFVIGSMRELGENSDEAHRQVGGWLRLGTADRAILIGEGANALRAGALEAGNAPDQLEVFPDTAVAARSVAAFRGVIFLKGSRAWRLESLVPAEAATPC